MQATRKQRGCSRGKAHLELDRAVFSGIRRTKLLPRGVFRTRKHPQSSGGARGGKARLELDSAVFSGIRRRKPPRSFGSRAAPQLREWGMQHAHDSAVLSERILADEPPQECRALGARRRALRVEAIAVLAVENTVFHGPGQRRTGIAADSARIGKAAQGIFRLRFIRSTRKAGITVKDGGQILPADRLRGAERIGAAAADHTGMIGPGNGEYCYTIAARAGEILDVQRPEKPAQTPETPAAPPTPPTRRSAYPKRCAACCRSSVSRCRRSTMSTSSACMQAAATLTTSPSRRTGNRIRFTWTPTTAIFSDLTQQDGLSFDRPSDCPLLTSGAHKTTIQSEFSKKA